MAKSGYERHGIVLAVTEEQAGDFLAVAATATDTEIELEDVFEFNPEGGTADIIDQDNSITESVTYTAIDYDTRILTLSAGLTNNFALGIPVFATPVASVIYAHVRLDGEEDAPVRARVPYSMRALLPQGMRDEVAAECESVIIEVIRGEWVIADVLGVQPTISAGILDTTDGLPSDGSVPGSSPTPVVRGGLGFLAVQWTAVANNDPVTYEVHVDTSTGFTADSSTLYAEVDGTIAFIKELPDGTPLEYGTTYYVKIIAKDEDGSAAASTEDEGQMNQAGDADILAGSITGEHLTGEFILGSTIIAGQPGSQRVELDAQGLRVVASDDEPLVNLPSDEDQEPFFKGTVVAGGLEVTGDASFQGTGNVMTPGSMLTVEDTIGNPTTAPQVSIYFPKLGLDATLQNRYGLLYDPDGDSGGSTPTFMTTRPGGNGYYRHIEEYDASTGDLLRSFTLQDQQDAWGVTRVGSSIWVLYRDWDTAQKKFYLHPFAQSNFADQGRVEISSRVINRDPGLFYDGTHLCVITTTNATSSAQVRLAKFNSSAVFQSNQDFTGLTVDGRFGTEGQRTEFSGGVLLTETGVNSDDPVYWIAMYSHDDASQDRRKVYGFDAATGAYISDLDFEGEDGAEADGLAHDGTNFYSQLWNGPIIQHSNWYWTTESNRYWLGYTWNDSDASGSGTHETLISPLASVDFRRRAHLVVSWPDIPGAGGVDDPNRIRLYAARGSTPPESGGRFNGENQGPFTGTSTILSDFDPAALQNPASNDFAASTPAEIVSGNSNGWELDGTGILLLPRATSPSQTTDGSIVWDSDGDELTIGDGSSRKTFVPNSWYTVMKTANETVNNSDTLQNDDALVFPVVASSTYYYEVVLIYSAGTAPDFKWNWSLPASATYEDYSALSWGHTGTGGTPTVLTSGDHTWGGAGVGGTNKVLVKAAGLMVIAGTAGNAQLQWAQNSATANNAVVYAGSHIRYYRVV